MSEPAAPTLNATSSGDSPAPAGASGAGARGPHRRFALGAAVVLLTAAAFLFRLPDLGTRPMHGDEGVHTFKFRELWETGRYRYDPNEFHGPTLYYATLPIVRLAGVQRFADTKEGHYRLSTVLFGAGLILLLLLLADGLGWRALLWAGILTAVSPAFVFYSRYYIQETFLVFFTLAAMGAGWRYLRSGKLAWAAAAGACAGLMIATKETAVLSFAAAGVALALAGRGRPKPVGGTTPARWWHARHAGIAAAVGVVVACLFLSGFGTNWQGPIDLFRSYAPWGQRAGATDLHQQPWYYYLQTLAYTPQRRGAPWTEGLILGLALVGLLVSFTRLRGRVPEVSPRLLRFVAWYTLVLTAAYAAIPYKTPWCLLGFHQGFILLAGVGATALVRWMPWAPVKAIALLALLAGSGHLAAQAHRASFQDAEVGRNPYAYSQTVSDILDLADTVIGISRVSDYGDRMVIKVIYPDAYYWPLPWYLRRFDNIGYYSAVPDDVAVGAPVVLAAPDFDAELAKRLGPTHQDVGIYGLRPMAFFQVWVRKDLWPVYLERGRGFEER